MTERYESPEVTTILTKAQIHERYQDTALVIFKVIDSIYFYSSFDNLYNKRVTL